MECLPESPRSIASGRSHVSVEAMTEWLTNVKSENEELEDENLELEALVESARQLAEQAEEVRSGVASRQQEDNLLKAREELVQKAQSRCGSRPTSAASSRFSAVGSRPASASKAAWKRPMEKPMSHVGSSASRPESAVSYIFKAESAVGGALSSILDSSAGSSFSPNSTMVPLSPVAGNQGVVARSFHVQLDRSVGGSLGMKIRSAGLVLEITKVKEEGLVSVWNEGNPSLAIQKGDRILAVNGKRGNAEELLHECTKPIFLRFVVETKREAAKL